MVWTAGLILHRRPTLNPLPRLHHLLSLTVSTENRASQPTVLFFNSHFYGNSALWSFTKPTRAFFSFRVYWLVMCISLFVNCSIASFSLPFTP